VAVALCGAAAVACSGPRVIPDEWLAEIFRDAYLTNAYTQTFQQKGLDSLNLYEPIFARYGYTTADVQYTIGNFAKRKNARMTDVVDRAIEMLTTTSDFYKTRVAIADTIAQIAREHSAKVVYADTLVRVRRLADTTLLKIQIPIEEEGTYRVSYYYTLDSTDRNRNLAGRLYLVDEGGAQSAINIERFGRSPQSHYGGSFTAQPTHRELVLDLNGYRDKEKPTRPGFTIDTLVVTRYLPDAVAQERLAREIFDTLFSVQ
jgi:hypothetical protein